MDWPRQGTQHQLRSRFTVLRVRPSHRDYWRAAPHAEEWLLIEWPQGASQPTKYWLSTLPAQTRLPALVKLAKHRWIIERDYEELKQELGLGHYEGRGWRGFHRHATLCIAAYGFLVAERNRFSPLSPGRTCCLTSRRDPPRLPAARRAAFAPSGITRIRSPRCASASPAICSGSLAALFVALDFCNTVVL
jgi:SRSO17 transposase